MNNKVCEILNALKSLTGLGICLYDTKNFFQFNFGCLEKKQSGHYCGFCNAVKKLPGGQKACDENDKIQVVNLALEYKKPFLHICHAGIYECIVPILRKNELWGVLFIGQCAIKGEQSFQKVFDSLSAFSFDKAYFELLYKNLPTASLDILVNAGKLADLAFKAVVDIPDIKENTSGYLNIAERAKTYIEYNYMNDISLNQISNKLYVNSSYLSRRFKEIYKINLTDFIIETRIEQSKNLLSYTNLPANHIALNVGFQDPNYFSRVFKRYTNKTPIGFRKFRTHLL